MLTLRHREQQGRPTARARGGRAARGRARGARARARAPCRARSRPPQQRVRARAPCYEDPLREGSALRKPHSQQQSLVEAAPVAVALAVALAPALAVSRHGAAAVRIAALARVAVPPLLHLLRACAARELIALSCLSSAAHSPCLSFTTNLAAPSQARCNRRLLWSMECYRPQTHPHTRSLCHPRSLQRA